MKEKLKRYWDTPTQCNCCDSLIGFHQKVNGSWMPVDLHTVAGREGYYYLTNMGNYQNLTVRHNCKLVLERKERLQKDQSEREQKAKDNKELKKNLQKDLDEELAKETPDHKLIKSLKLAIDYMNRYYNS